MAAIGLQTHIWSNNANSTLLLLGFPFLLLLMLFGFGAGMSGMEQLQPRTVRPDWVQAGWAAVSEYWPVVLSVAGGWFMIAWAFHQNMINSATGAVPMERRDNPRIYNMLENLCISRGITTPKLFIIESPALNAYASGISDKTYAITLTRGIIEVLDEEELEAVIAHELTHILNRDVRLLIIAVIFVGMISFFAEMAFRSLRFSRGGGKRGGAAILIAVVVLAIGYLFALVIRFALSRKREFLADAGAVELTKNPDAMARALLKISGRAKMEEMPDEVAQMCIENPPGFFSLFATHPPINARIDALVKFAGAQMPQLTDQEGPVARPWGRYLDQGL